MDILKYFVDNSYAPIMGLIFGVIYLLGMIFILRCFLKLKHLADFRNMMSGQQEVGKSIIFFIVGLFLFYTPWLLNLLTTSIWASSVQNPASGTPFFAVLDKVDLIAKILGIISFVRGWVMLANQNPQAQQGISKALTHIISGILLYNLNGTIYLLRTMFGI